MSAKLLVGINEKPSSKLKWTILSFQHVFAMFGATVLVPILTGLDIGVALVASGIGTLIYIACTRGKVPVYLGSSFAYIAAINASKISRGDGSIDFAPVFFGLMVVGLIYVTVALIIRFTGSSWLKKLLPPVVIGPMIIIIGLGLAPTAIEQSGLLASGTSTLFYPHVSPDVLTWAVPVVAIATFITVIGVSIFSKGFFKIVPFLIAIVVGWIASATIGLVDWNVFESAQFIQAPNFSFIFSYKIDASAILVFAPLAFVTIAEHIGDHSVLGEICDRDFLSDPGLDKTLLGDGIATFVSAALGGPANTTYGENTGIVAMTGVGSVWVTGVAAVIAISLGFFGFVQAFIMSIPWAVIGGMTIILYGLIAGNGVKVLVRAKTDLSQMRNIVVIATMLVIGLGGAVLNIGDLGLTGMSLAAIVGVILNLVLPKEVKA